MGGADLALAPTPSLGFFLHVGTFSPIFCYLFFTCMGGGGLFGLASSPYENFCGRPCSGVVGNFSCGTLSWHYGYISYRYRTKGGGDRLLRVKIHAQTWGYIF